MHTCSSAILAVPWPIDLSQIDGVTQLAPTFFICSRDQCKSVCLCTSRGIVYHPPFTWNRRSGSVLRNATGGVMKCLLHKVLQAARKWNGSNSSDGSTSLGENEFTALEEKCCEPYDSYWNGKGKVRERQHFYVRSPLNLKNPWELALTFSSWSWAKLFFLCSYSLISRHTNLWQLLGIFQTLQMSAAHAAPDGHRGRGWGMGNGECAGGTIRGTITGTGHILQLHSRLLIIYAKH